jgi:SAM-dependent methyltransferase
MNDDRRTAEAFARSWNGLPPGSVYTREQFEEWLAPITRRDVEGKLVLELGCGNASLLTHIAQWRPRQMTGVELGSSIVAADRNMQETGTKNYSLIRADLTDFRSAGFDLVYCIGVLHHLENPGKGVESMIANVNSEGRFHCAVYAREGNGIIIALVDPLRRITSRLPWWVTKYLVATPLVFPFFLYAKLLRRLRNIGWIRKAPLFEYSVWIAKRSYSFFRHVAFDQLVAPRTAYIDKGTVQSWLNHPRILPGSSYIVSRNGNSWKFGGRVR